MRNDLGEIKRIVIKIGSQAITSKESGLKPHVIKAICQDIFELQKSGHEIILISSGAIGAGRSSLKTEKREEISFLQAASAIGQPKLFHHYFKEFKKYEKVCAQILLTHEDFKNKKRYLNAKNTLKKLLENKIIPILNENDTVSFNEITVGDNDHLAAMTALMLEAHLLVIISTTDGLYDMAPENPAAKRITNVNFDEKLKIKTKTKSEFGRGGMKSKLQAIEKVTGHGIHALISGSEFPHPIKRALESEVGTVFLGNPLVTTKEKKKWITSTVKSSCKIVVDAGCAEALKKNRSLLPSGIKKIHGSFSRGDSVEIVHKKEVLAIGIVEYSSKETERIMGLKSSEIENVLGFIISEEIIHRSNLILKGK